MDEREENQRALVAKLAREWIGLRYYHQQRLRGVGGDCTFFVLIYEDAGVFPHIEVPRYSPQQQLNMQTQAYMEAVLRYAHEVAAPGVGDLVMYRWPSLGGVYTHAGIVVDPGWPSVVHASEPDRSIVLDIGNGGRLYAAMRRYFSPWAVRS